MSMRMPAYFISHGIGPWSYMRGPLREASALLEQHLSAVPPELPAVPRAVAVVSGHWEEQEITVATSPRPGMVYDYRGFPEYTYAIDYPAPGSPEVARRVIELLRDRGWNARSDAQRGLDVATFGILKPMYPNAEIPVVPISIKASYDAREHFEIGRALAALRSEGVLLIGSGFTFHNLGLRGSASTAPSLSFDSWLRRTLLDADGDERGRALASWKQAPAASLAHPSEEHLLPLMVIAGAAGDDPGMVAYGELLMGTTAVSSFRFAPLRAPSNFDRLAA